MRTTLDEERTCFQPRIQPEQNDKKLASECEARGPGRGPEPVRVVRLAERAPHSPRSRPEAHRVEMRPSESRTESLKPRSPASAEPTAEMQGAPREPAKQIQERPSGPAEQRPSQSPIQNQKAQLLPTSPPPKIYPNNTLVEDLSKCHDNLWPKAARATSKTLELVKSCLPSAGKLPTGKADKPRGSPGETSPTNPGELEEAQAASKKLKFVRARRKFKFPTPDSILRLNSTLNQEDYNRALCVLTGDIRFQLHILLSGRLQTIWTLFTTVLCILIPILLSAATLETFVIIGSCALWLCLQAAGLLVTSQCRKKLDQMLEKAVAQANSYFLDHKLMLGVINSGGLLAKSRLVIPMVYFDTFECIEQIESMLSLDLGSPRADGKSDKREGRPRLPRLVRDFPKFEAHEQVGANQKAFAQSQLAKKIVLRYSQRWISNFDRSKLVFSDDKVGPRHLSTGKCLCQFIEEHFGRQQRLEELEELRREAEARARPQFEQLRVVVEPEQERFGRGATLSIPNRTNHFNELDEQQLNESLMRPSGAQPGRGQQFDLFVPSLSHLISMKERQGEQLAGQARPAAQTDSADSSSGSQYSSKLIDGFASHLQQERLDSSSSPTTELSLDLDGESPLSRNEELIRRLKILLEIRSSEFSRGLDASPGSTASTIASQKRHTCPPAGSQGNSPRTNTGDRFSVRHEGDHGAPGESNQQSEGVQSQSASPPPLIGQLGKKFFSQADGLFFLSSKKAQQQQGVYAKQQQQLLQIC